MGRFYKTDSALPLDYMYSINTPLMERALVSNDQNITSNLDLGDKLSQLANFNYIPSDEQDAKAITDDYTKQINDITDAIRKDPANYKDQLGSIRNIKGKLQQDYQSGAISKIVGNYNKRKSDFDAIDKQVDLYHKSGGLKGVDPQRAALKKLYLDKQFDKTGYDQSSGNYNLYKGGSIMDNIDVRKRLSDGFDKLKADGIVRVGEGLTPGGEYFNKVTQKWEGFTQDKLLGLLSDRVAGDSQLWNYLKEDSDIGNINGAYDNSGNKILPYSIGRNKLAPDQQAKISTIQSKIDKTTDPDIKQTLQGQLDKYKNSIGGSPQVNWNNSSYLAPIMQGIINQYAYNKTDTENDLSNNSLYNTKLNINATNQRSALDRNLKSQIANQVNQRAAERFQFDKDKEANLEKDRQWKRDHPTEKGTKSTGLKSTTSKPLSLSDLPDSSGVAKVATNSFEDWNTTDNKTNKQVPVLSNAGLSNDIDNFKNDLDVTNRQLSNINSALQSNTDPSVHNQLLVKQQSLTNKAKQLESDLGERRQWYQMSVEAGTKDLTDDEKQIYNKYNRFGNKDLDVLRNKVEQTKKKYPSLLKKGLTNNDNIFSSSYEDSPQTTQAIKELQNYIAVKNKVDAGRENYLTGLRKDYIDEDGINLGQKDSEDVSDLVTKYGTGSQIFDKNGKSVENLEVDGKGLSWGLPRSDNYKLTFADGSLQKYIQNSGTTLVTKKVAPSTKIGNGNAVLEVQFNDPTGELPKGQNFYISASPELQKEIATKFKGNKNTEIANIAENIDDDMANSIRRQVAKPNTGRDQNFDILLPSNNGKTVPLKVTKVDNHLFVKGTKDGIDIPLPSLSGVPGSFNGVSELIQSLRALKSGKLK